MRPTDEQLEEMWNFIQSLKNGATIPYEVDAAFRSRFSRGIGLSVSAKGANTEDQAVNEAGSATFDVLGDPDGFLEVSINGTVYYIPYFT